MQPDLFAAPGSTAIYPNRLRDKALVEATRGWREQGDSHTRFMLPTGEVFAVGYTRIVYGDHGPYIEFETGHVTAVLRRKFDREPPTDSYYDWLVPVGAPQVKVYRQLRDVRNLPNPPAGGFRGNRVEGYADYRPGFLYVAPAELRASV